MSVLRRERPRIVIKHQDVGHGYVTSLLLLILAWPLAIAYWILRLVTWMVGVTVDWLRFAASRRRGR